MARLGHVFVQGIWPGEQHYLNRTAEVSGSNLLGSHATGIKQQRERLENENKALFSEGLVQRDGAAVPYRAANSLTDRDGEDRRIRDRCRCPDHKT
jgi:hypothetical protein